MTERPSVPSFDVDFDGEDLAGWPMFGCIGSSVGMSWRRWLPSADCDTSALPSVLRPFWWSPRPLRFPRELQTRFAGMVGHGEDP